MKKLLVLSGAVVAIAVAGQTLAAADGAKLYVEKTCVACHGKDAKTPILPDYPKLAGQNAAYAEKQMKDIKSGARANGNSAAMKGVMHLVSDAEIKVLAQYLSSLK
jgi:cytochrome c